MNKSLIHKIRVKIRVAAATLALASLLAAFAPHATADKQAYRSVQPNRITASTPALPNPDKAKVSEEFGKLPLSFEQNAGQTNKAVKFLARNPRYTMFLTSTEAVFVLRKFEDGNKVRREVLRMQLVGANAQPQIEARDELAGKSNYFSGSDQSQWRRNINTYARVFYKGVYPGIDMVYYGQQRELEYDFHVAPQADPRGIELSFKGASDVSLDREGDLHLKMGDGELVQPAPFIYQEVNGERRQIAGRFVIKQKPSASLSSKAVSIGFEVADYDRSLPLVIDPKVLFSTYFGGNIEGDAADLKQKGDTANGVAVDNGGNVYITGSTASIDFPVSSNAFVNEPGDNDFCESDDLACGDVYVSKLNSTGTQILYSAFIASDLSDDSRAIAVDASGNAYITGGTDPRVFSTACIRVGDGWPTTNNSYQNEPRCSFTNNPRDLADAFVTVLNSTGSDLIYSTYFGATFGDELGNAIAVDSTGKIYIAGQTTSNGLNTRNAFQNSRASSGDGNDAFVAKFDPLETRDRDTLLYSSFLGGTGEDIARGIAADAAGNAYVVGETTSSDLAVKSPLGQQLAPLQSSAGGGAADGFISKVDVTNASGASSLIYLSYFGGSGRDIVNAVAVEALTQRAHITGRSDSASGFPLVNAFDTLATLSDAFVARLNADGTALFYSSFLGSSSIDEGRGIALDAASNVYVTGQTLSTGFPRVNAFQNSLNSIDGDAFVTKLSAVGNTPARPKILYSSFLGGGGTGGAGKDIGNSIAVDRRGNVYIAGQTASTSFPTTAGVVKASSGNVSQANLDAFVTKVESTFADTIGVFNPAANQFRLRNSNAPGPIDQLVNFGQAGDIAVVGDWNGDGIKDPGVFRPGDAQFVIKKVSLVVICNPTCHVGIGSTTLTINFGQNGDLPVAGDWDNDGVESVGVFRPSAGQFLLTDDNVANPNIDHTINFGISGDIPVGGDWNSDGRDTVGVFRPSAGTFFLTNKDELNPTLDITAAFGTAEDLPVAGDWDGDGKDSIGVWRPSVATFFLGNNNDSTVNITAAFGANGDQPVAGDWDGKP